MQVILRSNSIHVSYRLTAGLVELLLVIRNLDVFVVIELQLALRAVLLLFSIAIV
jgi:hypothetical protein